MGNIALLMAAMLTIFIGFVHSWLGEKRLIGPLLAPDQRRGMLAHSRFSRQVLRFAWHLTTISWYGFAAILVYLAGLPVENFAETVMIIIAVTFVILGTVTLATSGGRHLAWIVFYAIAGLSLVPLL